MQKIPLNWTNTSVTCPQQGQEYFCFKQGFQTLPDLFDFAKQHFPNRVFIVDGDKRITFLEFFNLCESLSQTLLLLPNLQAMDRIGICGKNSFQWMICYTAIVLTGKFIAVPLNSWWTAKELDYAIKRVDLKLVFCDEERLLRFPNSPCQMVCYSDFEQFQLKWMSSPTSSLQPCETPLPENAGMIMFTSGTTNFPKGVVLTHRGICHIANVLLNSKVTKRTTLGECMLCTVPLFHAMGKSLLRTQH